MAAQSYQNHAHQPVAVGVGYIIALIGFALPALLERAARESMTPDGIKRAVRNWVPDYDRT
jgi:uncharacterized protein DUF6526